MPSQLQRRFSQHSAGVRPVPPTIAYRATPVYVPEDYPTLQAAFDAVVDGATWETVNVPLQSGNTTTTAASETVTGVNTSYLTDVAEEDFLFHSGQYYPVRDIASDTSLRLWKGANVSFSLAGLRNRPTFVTIVTENDDNTVVGTIPDGVSLQIVGTDITKRLSGGASASITRNNLASLELHNLTMVGGASLFTIAQGFSTSSNRGVFRASQLQIDSPSNVGMFLETGSGIILSDIVANKWKFNGYSDYFSATDISSQNAIDDDVMLMNIADTTNDLAYEHEVDGFIINKFDGSGDNFAGGLEWNNWAAAKVANVRNSVIINKNVAVTAQPSYPVFSPLNGTINFFDSIIDSDSATVEEINGRGATINFNNTTKLDGSTLPRIA